MQEKFDNMIIDARDGKNWPFYAEVKRLSDGKIFMTIVQSMKITLIKNPQNSIVYNAEMFISAPRLRIDNDTQNIMDTFINNSIFTTIDFILVDPKNTPVSFGRNAALRIIQFYDLHQKPVDFCELSDDQAEYPEQPLRAGNVEMTRWRLSLNMFRKPWLEQELFNPIAPNRNNIPLDLPTQAELYTKSVVRRGRYRQ